MFKKQKEKTQLDRVIEREIGRLVEPTTSQEFAKQLTVVEKLMKIRKDHQVEPDRISKETMALIGANLLGILLIIRHENVNVITSKALGMLPRLRTTV